MNRNSIFVIFTFSFAVFLSAFLIILFATNPYQSSWSVHLAFFISLFLAITAILSLVNFYIRCVFFSENTNLLPTGVAIRQGFLIALGIIGLLLLYTARVLNLFDGFLLILAILLIELYYQK